MRINLALALLIIYLTAQAAQGDLDIPVTSGGGTKSRSSSGQIDFDHIFKALQEGKNKKPDKFDELKKLLYIEPFTTEDYDKGISFGLNISNKTPNRGQEIRVMAIVDNPNPVEIRRALWLDLDILEPDAKEFKQVNTVPLVINVGEYTPVAVNGEQKNRSIRVLQDLRSFSHLNSAGIAILRLRGSDGQYNYQSVNYSVNITNTLPVISDPAILGSEQPRYYDPIEYVANVSDADGDLLDVTLHILDDQGRVRDNATQQVLSGNRVSFKGIQYGFFGEEDAGKDFDYYFTVSDGLDNITSMIQEGPKIKEVTRIRVENPQVIPESEDMYWWQSYSFNIMMCNPAGDEIPVTVRLFTDTSANPGVFQESKRITLNDEMQLVSFDIKPFNVNDANLTYRYRFEYSERDQNDQTSITKEGGTIGSKVLMYSMASIPMLANILCIFAFVFLGAFLVERRFYR